MPRVKTTLKNSKNSVPRPVKAPQLATLAEISNTPLRPMPRGRMQTIGRDSYEKIEYSESMKKVFIPESWGRPSYKQLCQVA